MVCLLLLAALKVGLSARDCFQRPAFDSCQPPLHFHMQHTSHIHNHWPTKQQRLLHRLPELHSNLCLMRSMHLMLWMKGSLHTPVRAHTGKCCTQYTSLVQGHDNCRCGLCSAQTLDSAKLEGDAAISSYIGWMVCNTRWWRWIVGTTICKRRLYGRVEKNLICRN